jgi:RNA polymerase sigma-70 factor, ECF subfamily
MSATNSKTGLPLEESLFSGLRRGSSWAEEELCRRFWPRVCQLVEREMDRRLRRREDPEDVAQTVFRTFFGRAQHGDFQCAHTGALWCLLQQIARRKILKRAEHHGAKKRDVRREQEPVLHREFDEAEASFLWDVVEKALARDNRPEPRILLLEMCGYTLPEICEKAMAGLKSPDPEIFDMWLEGYTWAEIAEKVGYTQSTVRHKIDRICERLRRWLGEGEAV